MSSNIEAIKKNYSKSFYPTPIFFKGKKQNDINYLCHINSKSSPFYWIVAAPLKEIQNFL